MEDDRKHEKKRKRFAARLNTLKGIVCYEDPRPNVILCNVGQATGFDKQKLMKLLTEYKVNTPLPKFVAEKGESYSYLMFDKAENASLFYEACNGKAQVDENGTTLYVTFVENVPDTDIICKHPNPKGLHIIPDFLTEDEEKLFLNTFNIQHVETTLKNRQVKHYGYEFRYGSNDVDLSCPLQEKIPKICKLLWRRLQHYGYDLGVPVQLTVNKYLPGQGIPSHVDKHSPFGETILALSLGSNVVMDWKHHTGKYVPVMVEARSMMIMQDEARYDWQHGIQPRMWDPVLDVRLIDNEKVKVITSDTVQREMRISLTFRWTRCGPCKCEYKMLCDSIERNIPETISNDVASNIEDIHVHQVYEQIAGHFSTTRHKPWPKVVDFMQHVPAGSIVLDLGCGNGKNILNRTDILQVAGERSSGLLEECKGLTARISGADCIRLDLLNTGLKDECADFIICVAVVHHFSTQARRLHSLQTIHRLLRTNGQALITVWAKDQTKSSYLSRTRAPLLDRHKLTVGGIHLPVHENRTQFQHKDLLVPWNLRSKAPPLQQPDTTFLRYYHVFDEGELDQLCRDARLAIVRSFYEEGNWCVVCMKV
ncbi:alkylated DNA repair protein alkB homolog 8 [Bombyx mandarina]|uniref:Alkylated DNA repair protein alkB homolog 8 n=1 Tax=Bombyx mandarina TaxID=7092 RepID=A0A6J2J9E0_BOMMA|nr:alkylated DNA repair protein alkB homolog 8 [Bombyx mandarina]